MSVYEETLKALLENLFAPRNLDEHQLLVIARVADTPLLYWIAKNRKTGGIFAKVHLFTVYVLIPSSEETKDVRALGKHLEKEFKELCDDRGIPFEIEHSYPPDGTGLEVLKWLVKFDLVRVDKRLLAEISEGNHEKTSLL